uniref:Uncharacterized protein n=1 Tax=Arundo donax TaxID=35708 RepID=A0A0A9EW32_ARUDO
MLLPRSAAPRRQRPKRLRSVAPLGRCHSLHLLVGLLPWAHSRRHRCLAGRGRHSPDSLHQLRKPHPSQCHRVSGLHSRLHRRSVGHNSLEVRARAGSRPLLHNLHSFHSSRHSWDRPGLMLHRLGPRHGNLRQLALVLCNHL